MKNPNANSAGPFLRVESPSDKETKFVRKEYLVTIVRTEKTVVLEGIFGSALVPVIQATFDSENLAASFATRVMEMLTQAGGR